MADGPRCKRRKQANPKRSSVTNFNNGPEASSDSDDEDKLHIVEEESQEEKSHKKNKPVLPVNGDCNGVKDDCGSEDGDEAEDADEEEEEAEVDEAEADQKDALVQEILQQKDTAVIYPEAPEENTVETGGADENGTPDSPPLHICPYCSRGYKRNASLKEHIKYRHETSDDNYSCSHCSYTFTYRSQLERHMNHHRGSKEQTRAQNKPQRHSQSSGGSAARKFKCNECAKAFKYKHHLKEHLRIHSGEKPYECANCKKRFSHSGSYSSHITSKKCAAAHFPNGLNHPPLKPQQVASMSAKMAVTQARKDSKMDSKPLQEQIPLTQIKTEPIEEDIKPTIVPPVNGVNRSGTALSQSVAMVVPTVGLMSPIGINISSLQNVFGKVLATGTQGKQGFVVQQPQQQIISLPAFVDHDGTTKIIINYSLSPAAATTANSQPTSLAVKNSPPAASVVPTVAAAPIPSRTEQSCTGEVQEFPTDLSISKIVKEEPDCVPISEDLGIVISKTESVAEMPKGSECLLCEECPEHLEAVHLLQHRKAANGEAVDSAALDPSFADLLSEAGVTLHQPSPTEDVLSVLKTAFASNMHPSDYELGKISEKVSIPTDVVQKWFAKMNRKANHVKSETEDEADTSMQEASSEETEDMECQDNPELPVNLKLQKNSEFLQKSKSKMQEKSKLKKKSESLEKSETQEQSETQDKAETKEKSEKESSITHEKSVSQANLELHNYSKPLESQTDPGENNDAPNSQSDSQPNSHPEPLDLTLPKSASPEEPTESLEKHTTGDSPEKVTVPANVLLQQNLLQKLQTTPLNLACINKDQLEPRALYVTTPQSGNSNFVTATQIPTLVAIAGQGTVGCLSAINPTTKQRTILIPQLTYTYTPTASKGVLLNRVKKEKKDRLVSAQKSVPPAGARGNDQKKTKADQGIYACDICCKVFQKGSSLLRHKYEHTGRRPHECPVCKKAFKHKHHLIEHARLHTGIKPYQCDKCGKRFSHSGSYSQHMNHRYSYCKRSVFNASSASSASSPAAPEPTTTLLATAYEQSNGVPSPAPEETLSPSGSHATSERDSEDEEAAYEEAMCVDDIRVVQVDDAEDRQDSDPYEEQDGDLYEEQDGDLYEEQDGDLYEEQDGDLYEEQDGDLYEEQEGDLYEEQDGDLYEEQDGDQYEEQDAEHEQSGEEMEVELGEGSEEESENETDGTYFREGSRRTSVRAK